MNKKDFLSMVSDHLNQLASDADFASSYTNFKSLCSVRYMKDNLKKKNCEDIIRSVYTRRGVPIAAN
jgi:hypothetical protein